jgi:predicted ArsR family transcriptional regulator
MPSAEQVDQALLASLTTRWTKAAMVAARAMTHIPQIDDATLRIHLQSLQARGLIEAHGDLADLRHSEIRLRLEDGDV